MGCDGGSIQDDRKVIVQLKEDDKKPSNEFIANIGWSTCALSGEPLKAPIVCDQMGILYNKISLLEAMGNKTLDFERFGHIRNLKSLTNVNFAANPEHAQNPEKPLFICPSTKKEISGTFKFFVLHPCGHVCYEKVFEEIDDKECVTCGTPFDKTKDTTLLNPLPEQIEELRPKFKKTQKRKRNEEEKKISKLDEILEKNSKKKNTSEDKVYNSLFSKESKTIKNDYMNRGGMRSVSDL
jgi:hypothetical protein